MAGVQGSALAVAVCNAGGLGSLPAALLDIDDLRAELTAIRAQTTKPFNVNFFCHAEPRADAHREAAWRAALAPYFAELGIDPNTIPPGPSDRPSTWKPRMRWPTSSRPSSAFISGCPPRICSRACAPGARRSCPPRRRSTKRAGWRRAAWTPSSRRESRRAGIGGCFCPTTVATQVGTLALVPQIADAVKVPVIAAGGIADARGVAAAMALGASGVQVGTAYLLCPETTTSAVHRAALKSEAARVTALTNVFTGRPARAIVNRVVRELGPISTRRAGISRGRLGDRAAARPAESLGSGDFSPLWAGPERQRVPGDGRRPLTRELASGART